MAARTGRLWLVAALVAALVIGPFTTPPASAAAPVAIPVAANRTTVRLGRAVTLSGAVPLADGEYWRTVTVQRRVAGRWEDTAATYPGATYELQIWPAAGTWTYRVVAPPTDSSPMAVSVSIRLTATTAAAPKPADSACAAPVPAPVDPDIGPRARCVLRRFDTWAAAGRVPIGQQLNVSNPQFMQPIDDLGSAKVAVAGIDLGEVTAAWSFGNDPVPGLIELARSGVVLTASWHVGNPGTRGDSWDTSWHALGRLKDTSTTEGARFWGWWDAQLAVLARFQAAGVPIIVRPFHEATGPWFWWGNPDPTAYRRLWRVMQQRTWAAGVHDVIWSYGTSAKTWGGMSDPTTLVPGKVDMGGLDTYDPEWGAPADHVDLTDYKRLRKVVPRMGLTEVGPADGDGSWDPAVVIRTLRAAKVGASVAMFWFDDAGGPKEIAHLVGGPAWLATCAHGLCRL